MYYKSVYSDWFWLDLSATTNSKQYSLLKVCMLSGLSQTCIQITAPIVEQRAKQVQPLQQSTVML